MFNYQFALQQRNIAQYWAEEEEEDGRRPSQPIKLTQITNDSFVPKTNKEKNREKNPIDQLVVQCASFFVVVVSNQIINLL